MQALSVTGHVDRKIEKAALIYTGCLRPLPDGVGRKLMRNI